MKVLRISAAAVFLLWAALFIRFHSSDPIEAWVVDDAGQPLEGVAVAAHWQSDIHTLGGRIPGSQIMILGAATDAKGRFYLPGWGPRIYIKGSIDEKNPEMVLFKSGYSYVRLTENVNLNGASAADKKIRMQRFSGDMDSYREHLWFLNSDLSYLMDARDCSWRRISEMVLALKSQDEVFMRSGITDFHPISTWLEDSEKAQATRGCGSVSQFLKGNQR